MKPKYKIGDIIVWSDDRLYMAEIIEINHYEYIYRFIEHPNKICINVIWKYEIKLLESFTRVLTKEDKLALL